MNLSHLSIGRKIALAAAIEAIFLVLIVGYNAITTNTQRRSMLEYRDQAELVLSLMAETGKFENWMGSVLTRALNLTKIPEDEIKEVKLLEIIDKLPRTEETAKDVGEIKEHLGAVFAMLPKLNALVDTNVFQAQALASGDLPKAVGEVKSRLGAIVQSMRSINEKRHGSMLIGINRASSILMVFSIFAMALGVLVFWGLARSIVPRLKLLETTAAKARDGDFTSKSYIAGSDEVAKLAGVFRDLARDLEAKSGVIDAFARGDFTAKVQRSSDRDTIGHALQNMQSRLSGMISEVRHNAERLASHALELNHASGTLSSGATEQASSLEEISATMSELSSNLKSNAAEAMVSKDAAQAAQVSANSGKSKLDATVAVMNEIKASSQSMAKIVRAIDDIAFQTNLLALNAAVEAARAGVHGKGFAVVADEVRNLATRSSKEAKEAQTLLESVNRSTENGVMAAEETAKEFLVISENIGRASNASVQLATSIGGQASSVIEVARSLEEVSSIVQRNTATAEETAAAATELTSLGGELNTLVSQFRLMS